MYYLSEMLKIKYKWTLRIVCCVSIVAKEVALVIADLADKSLC